MTESSVSKSTKITTTPTRPVLKHGFRYLTSPLQSSTRTNSGSNDSPRETLNDESSPSTVVYLSDGYDAVLRHDPFEIYVRDKQSGNQKLISLNSHQLLDFEQLRVKKEGEEDGENWEERFRGHTDTRPYGPQSISFDVSFYSAEFVSGIPERAMSLALKPTRGPGVEKDVEPYRLFNLDVFEYLSESPFGLYGSLPLMISHGKEGRSAGFFWLNAAEMQIDVLGDGWDAESGIDWVKQKRIDTFWMSEAGIVDAFFFVGPGPKEVVRQYTSVTGRPAMPQLFSIAYHQCRWNYRDEEDVENVDAKFDEHDIPYDVLWLDIDHTDGRRYFTWDSALFPHPEEMQKKLAEKGRHMVTIVDPHIKRDDSFRLHKEAAEKGSWWGDKFSYENYVGSTPSLYIWNDMNEPSVFNGPEVSMPRDALHLGGIEHRELHNSYGYYFHMATSNGLLKRGGGNDRPFVLSRAFFPGSQRYGPVWTGDNTADWDHLRVSVPMILTLGLTGISFSGADVGGYFGNPGPELLVRWYQLGAFYPFFRGHAHQDTKRREPWLFGEKNTRLIREAIRVRYMLLPYFYTLFREANTTGLPVMRPLWMEFPSDEATFSNDEAFMIGSSLLVQGIYTEGKKYASVYLPGKELWKDRLRRSSTQMVKDPYTLVIAVNSSQAAEGELYIDDGKSFEFLQGAYIHRRFVFANGKLTSINLAPFSSSKSQFSSKSIIERIILLGYAPGPKNALIEPANQKVEVELGPLMLGGSHGSSVLTIRKPAVLVSDDWTIKIL
ncbi:ALPHA-GLUCOSIDASE [Salix purpurea]|uniref:Glucosidase II subunit alpha n=1 Tax=Salix purpurea TaxID=77065 RepID=A0A9Q0WZ30_SALPP|nr:ALPHA-GLUCOSIDASE [Salix purpurea]